MVNKKYLKLQFIILLDEIKFEILSESKFTIGISPMSGSFSKLIFIAHCLKLYPKEKTELQNILENDLEKLIRIINENSNLNNSFFEGIAGFGFGIAVLKNMGIDCKEIDDSLVELDNYFVDYIKENIKSLDYDLFYGLIGLGSYFIQRFQLIDDKFSQVLKTIGDELISRATIFENDQIIWIDKLNSENNEIDLSISHGMASKVLFLTKLVQLNIGNQEYREVIKKANNFFLCSISKNRFPDIIINRIPKFSPLRWCHGDLGVVYAMAFSSKILTDPDLNERAYEVACEISKLKSPISQNLFSSTMCHGTIGVGYMFNKLYHQFWNKSPIKSAANYWLNESVRILSGDIKFKYIDNENKSANLSGILNGREGIGLALISFLNSSDNFWDKALLLYE